jgi:hypothetical protein
VAKLEGQIAKLAPPGGGFGLVPGAAAQGRGRGSSSKGSVAAPSVAVAALPVAVDPRAAAQLGEALQRLGQESAKRTRAEAATREGRRQAEARQADLDEVAQRRARLLEETEHRLAQEADKARSLGDTARQEAVKARQAELVEILEAPKRAAAARKAKAEAAAKAKAAAAAKAKAAAAAKAKAAMTPHRVGRPAGVFPQVRCPGGGSIAIDGSLAHNLNALLLTAWSHRVNLCGRGHRNPQQQIQMRIQNCGSSRYAIYQMPPGACSPPTAIPGTSNHERGLAVDFRCAGHGIPTRSSPCFGWLARYAARFGFFNLPSEAWHWSTTGS